MQNSPELKNLFDTIIKKKLEEYRLYKYIKSINNPNSQYEPQKNRRSTSHQVYEARIPVRNRSGTRQI